MINFNLSSIDEIQMWCGMLIRILYVSYPELLQNNLSF